MNPIEFQQKWTGVDLKERSAAQEHFLDLCAVLGHQTPARMDPEGTSFTFERGAAKSTGGQGWADVWYRGHFAWEYKGPHKDLVKAYDQLLRYKDDLENPPLLIVSDLDRIEIHTNFTGTVKQVHIVTLESFPEPESLDVLRKTFYAPDSLKPSQTVAAVTEEASRQFGTLAAGLRARDADPHEAAHFLMQLLFCLFAEDIGILPNKVFSKLLDFSAKFPARFVDNTDHLLTAMATGGEFNLEIIPHVNGGLFSRVKVFALTGKEIETLAASARLDWSSIEPAIFGTLFERSLDPSRRAQLGAHYTGRSDIERVVEPVVMTPLRREWAEVRARMETERATALTADTTQKRRNAMERMTQIQGRFLDRLAAVKVLDPACGSGNFLYVALDRLLALEKEVIMHGAEAGAMIRLPQVGPRQLLGMEIDPLARELAQVAIWIGYLQWMVRNGFGWSEPVLEPLETIRLQDALLTFLPPRTPDTRHVEPVETSLREAHAAQPHDKGDVRPEQSRAGMEPASRLDPNPVGEDLVSSRVDTVPHDTGSGPGNDDTVTAAPGHGDGTGRASMESAPANDRPGVTETKWPAAEFIIGNPPFLGGYRMRGELGDRYTRQLWRYFDGRLPSTADLVCYFFEKARMQIETGAAQRSGLLATSSIRNSGSRRVLERINETGRIFLAWADLPWVLDGAALRISIVGFDNGTETNLTLDGNEVSTIHSDLTSTIDLSTASRLPENARIAFMGMSKKGPFELTSEQARAMLAQPLNVNGRPNSDVVKPWHNARAITARWPDSWIVDFGATMNEHEASLYEAPFEYIERAVKPVRAENNRASYRDRWWLHAEPRPALRTAIDGMSRILVTPVVSKHRVFAWLPVDVLPDQKLMVFARDDDYIFGVLHSRAHEVWSLRMGSRHGVGNDPIYNNSTCFETFPLPWPPGTEPVDDPRVIEIGDAAANLDRLRRNWLDPEGASDAELKKRTLTNLYNQRLTWLRHAHDRLDRAVWAAYGWDDPDPATVDEDTILARLLALNLERAAG